MNQKNLLGLNACFLDLNDPVELFKAWMKDAENSEINDPNALSLATADKHAVPSVRIVLLKDFSKNGFVFYTNLESQKGKDLKENPKASMCFHWKSLLRQIRINGIISKVEDKIADKYFNSRSYKSKIGAWASKQSSILQNRQQLLNSIEKYKKKYDENKIFRPSHWSGWNLKPLSFEFWLDGENRIHERLKYIKNKKNEWTRNLLNP